MARKTKTQEIENNTLATIAENDAASAQPRRKRQIARQHDPHESTAEADSQPKPALRLPDAPRPGSKIAQVICLLERAENATLGEMVEVTGWQPHTTRASLTGLKKKGRMILKGKRGDVTCYRLEVTG